MLIPFRRYIYSKIKKTIKVKNSRNQGFSSFFVVAGRSWIRICTYKLQIRIQIQEATKHPTDPEPDPEHGQEPRSPRI